MKNEHLFTSFQKYTSTELCHFFKKNGFTELDEIVTQNNIRGETVMTLKEFEIMKWRMSMAEKRKLWAFLRELKENPQKFFDQDAPQLEKKFITAGSSHKLLSRNTDLKEKLEQIIGNKPLITTSKSIENDSMDVSQSEKNVTIKVDSKILIRQNTVLKGKLEQIIGNKPLITTSKSIENDSMDVSQSEKNVTIKVDSKILIRQNTVLKGKLEQIIGNKPLITTSKSIENDHLSMDVSQSEKNVTKVDSNHELIRQNTDLKGKLEQIIGNKTSINASSINDVKEYDYLAMDTKKNLHDEHGYTIILNSVERPVKKNQYETIKPTKFRFKPKIQEPAQIEIFSRKPMVFPRSDVDDEGYIQGPGLPLMIHGINQNTFPRIRRNIEAPNNEDVSNNTDFYVPMSKNNECKEAEEGIYERMSFLSEIVPAREDLYEPMSPLKGEKPKFVSSEEGIYERMTPLSKNNECKESEDGIYERISFLSEIVPAREDLYEPMSPPKGEKPKLVSPEEGIYETMESATKIGSLYENSDYEMNNALKLRRSSSEGQLIGLIQKHSLMMYTNSLGRKKPMKRPLPPLPKPLPKPVTPIFQNSQRRFEKLTDEIKEPNVIFKKRPTFPKLVINEPIKMYENCPKKAPTLPSPPESFPEIDLDPFLISLLNEETNISEETFYRDIDLSGVKRLLSGLEDGASLLRPSKKHFLTLTVKYKQDFFHFEVKKTANGIIRLKTDTVNPDFANVQQMISYFSKQPFMFRHKNGVVKLILQVLNRNMF